ncbi:ShlB/FhaC/HecB family hemolysin secretion/activation protein [Magnetospirillum gryphiswaldense]|uniref:Heme/hemopexin transporter protein huxB n=2 Tax=Magnetospirillum gryphiswaldense TaxID=55518 RepID=V6F1B6_MAGGM|nr:ShlB/FhaC/HecB family hemolysin secretion/activation protein [Magnetospirillum gryphiswaldense]AVM75125.1 Heme/hemopexin transporter protein HuxB precursor [Magnetospirillum gryphiswaldense MSR-1]AVM79028.1 Heme/hemopexin transporter protein HuxB precursor [Magnetospirillum gryphiswaldense]CAM76892.1 Hemolysin activation/secretion protein [Magnetospirillum gryphiswaldense MSR-1]CDK99192.1 putative Heme/hemopexin transporter protein huxB [Magnetospirillum gryphiswaldense MSR-1 v2]
MSRSRLVLTAGVCLAALTATANAWAQVNVAVVPGGADPGRIEKRYEAPRKPQSVIEPQAPEIDEQMPPDQSDKIRLTLNGVSIEGATVFSVPELSVFHADKLGKEVSLTEIYKVADEITAKYRNAGYILSKAIVPPQRIAGGNVTLRVVEGHVNEVLIEGEANGRAALFHEWGERIKESKPLDNKVLERYSLLANDLPGVKAKAVLRPSKTTPGASDVVFVIEHKYIDLSASFDNRGTKTSGPREYTLGAGINSVLGLYEKTSVSWINTTEQSELRYLAIQHDEVLNSEGTKLTLSGNRSRGEPGESLRDLEQRSRNVTLSAALSHPLIRTRAENFSLSTGFTSRDSRSEQLGQISSSDHTRAFKLGGSYDFSDSWDGVNLLALDLYRGIDGLGATRYEYGLKSRARGRADFTKLTLDASRTQQLPNQFALIIGMTGQWSANALLSSEEFGYGGSQYGRAYDSSEITGDNGIAGKLELQYTNQVEDIGLKYYQPFIFYDAGLTHDRDPVNTNAVRTGTSAGIGIRFGLTDYFSGSLEIDKPLTRPVSANLPGGKGKEPRLFFSISARY